MLLTPLVSPAPHCGGQRLRPGRRAAAGGRGANRPAGLRRLAAPPRRSLLGTGKKTGHTHAHRGQTSNNIMLDRSTYSS